MHDELLLKAPCTLPSEQTDRALIPTTRDQFTVYLTPHAKAGLHSRHVYQTSEAKEIIELQQIMAGRDFRRASRPNPCSKHRQTQLHYFSQGWCQMEQGPISWGKVGGYRRGGISPAPISFPTTGLPLALTGVAAAGSPFGSQHWDAGPQQLEIQRLRPELHAALSAWDHQILQGGMSGPQL